MNSGIFTPKRVYFEPAALSYPLGEKLYNLFSNKEEIKVTKTASHNRITGIPGSSPAEAYKEAKNTLVVGVRKSREFQTCKPSAHYQLPLATSCPGKCEYCYLATNLGKKPYIRIYVNVEEILAQTQKYIEQRSPETTYFEGAATSDPLPVEEYTGSLKKTIEFFSKQSRGKFRFVTKFANVGSLLDIKHQGNTHFRFSINLPHIISEYEHSTPSLNHRINALEKVSAAGYYTGVMIAPIFLEGSWESDYLKLLKDIKSAVHKNTNLTFELITHRFTKRAKSNIAAIYPHTNLPMDEEKRKFKYGQFGYGKYLYTPELMKKAENFFRTNISELFPDSKIEYFV